VFNKGHVFPFSKMLTFYRKENLILEASYSNPIPHTQTVIGWSTDCVVEFNFQTLMICFVSGQLGNTILTLFIHTGRFEIGPIKPAEDGSSTKVKVKVKVDIHSLFTVESAHTVTKVCLLNNI